MNLQEQFMAVAKEYARQFGEIIGYELEMWTGILDGHAALFGDNCFACLEEMAIVVDLLPRWIARYGSKEAVGQEVRDWMDWAVSASVEDITLLEGIDGEERPEYIPPYKRINLYSWLKGFRPEMIKTSGETAGNGGEKGGEA